MYTALTFSLFLFANIFIYIYSVISKDGGFVGWKILLIPLIFFPVLYLANIAFSGAWGLSNKAEMSLAVAGVSNLAIGVLVFTIGHIVYYKESFDWKLLLGSGLVIAGAIVLNLK